MTRYLLPAAFLIALFAMYSTAEEPTGCSTDTECMALCPPPADDPDCDGGPQSFDSHL